MPTFNDYEERNGSIVVNGKTYAFTGKATRTNRVFDGSVHYADENGNYYDEWCCNAVDWSGAFHVVYWLFIQVKGSEVESDDLPWNDCPQVRVIFQ